MALTRSPIFRIAAVLAILALPVAGYAANAVGRASGGGSSIEWQLNISGYESVELTVVGPDGEVWVKKFPAGRTPSFRLLDMGGSAMDGQYNYQMRVEPKVSSDLRKKLDKARASGDEAAARKAIRDAGIVVQEQSGAITILNGMIVSPDLVEADSNDSATAGARGFATEATTIKPRGIAAEDQVIADDLIVQGSICTGFDCVNNESFGFDTLRLKENNLRIHFDDTSASAGFPATDWRIIANDSASGGANYLSVEDSSAVTTPFKIEGASPTNSLFVDSTGRIGFRNSAPVLDLHLTDTDTPALRLEQSNAGGFTAQTWDVAGNEANFFVRDVTGGSLLSFRIRPGAPTSSLDISSDGDIGMGTASPNANTSLDVSDATQVKAKIALTGQEFYQASNTDTEGVALVLGVNRSLNRQLWIADTSALTQNATNQAIRIYPNAGEISATATNGNTTKTLSLNGLGGNVGVATFSSAFPFQVGDAGAGDGNGAHVTTGGVWTNGSSRSFKNNIAELSAEEAMAAVAALKPVRYNYLSEPNEQYVGFIAEDVPELVAQTSEDRKYLSPMDIVATLTKVVQEQQKTIDELSKKVNELEKNH